MVNSQYTRVVVGVSVVVLCAILPWCRIFAQAAAPESVSPYAGRQIQDVTITCMTAPDLIKLIEKQVTFQSGDRFSAAAIRDTIRNIYRLNRFSQVVVEADEGDGGVRISICPVQIRSIAKLTFSGNRTFSQETLRDVLGLNVGDGLPSNDPQYLAQPLLKFYREHGYHQVQVFPQIVETESGSGVMVTIAIEEGEPSTIGSITFTGQTVLTEAQLRKISGLLPGKTFTLDVLDAGFERVQAAYAQKSYLNVELVSQDVTYDFDSGEANVRLALVEGPRTVVRFDGNTDVNESTLKKRVSLQSAGDVSESALEGFRQTVLDWYRERGYHFSAVSVEYREEQQEHVVLFRIDEGPRVAVERLVIEGNTDISTKDVQQAVLTDTGGWFTTGWYQEAVFDEDVQAIQALYQQRGYLGAEIVAVEKAFSPDRSRVSLRVTVREGVQTRIAEVRILGERDPERQQRLERLNTLTEDEPLQTSKVAETVSLLRNFYQNLGYLNASIDVSTAFNDDNSRVIVTFQISAGQQFFVGNILIQGVVKTKKSFITRELLLKEGDILNPQKVRETVRRLHQLGLYSSVQFRRLDSKSTDPIQNMAVIVEETASSDIQFDFGYNTELGARGVAEYSDRNVLNYGGRGIARADVSLERPKITLQYMHPHVGTRDTRLIASLFDEFQRDNPAFVVEKRGGRLAVHHTFDPTLSLSVGYVFQQVDPSKVKKAAQISPYDTRVLNLGGLDTQVIWDFRDDLIQPRKGGVNQLSLRMTSESLGAEAEFFEAQALSNWYWRAVGDVVVACALNGRLIEPADGSKQVPIYDRYFLGGDNTVRGFQKHEIGPLGVDDEGNTERAGGNRLVRANAEVRFPVYGPFGGVLFYDVGANWINEDGFHKDLLREGAGLGLRVATPIGPLRLDYGWKLDRESGESPGEFYLTIGSAF